MAYVSGIMTEKNVFNRMENLSLVEMLCSKTCK